MYIICHKSDDMMCHGTTSDSISMILAIVVAIVCTQ